MAAPTPIGVAAHEVQPTTFTDLYSTDRLDPFAGNYTAIFNEYAVNPNGRNANSDSLLERVVAAPELRQCFVLMIADGVRPRQIVNVHNFSHYAARMGQSASMWDGKYFAFQGDLFTGGTNIQTVEVPPLLLEPLQSPVRVPVVNNVTGAVAQLEANAQGIAPLAEEAVDTEKVRTRMAVMVPPPYVALVLQKRRSPSEFWTDIVGQVLRDGKQDECKPLLDWARVALMNDENGDCAVAFPSLSVPLMDSELARHRQIVLANVLPSVGRGGGGLAGAPQMTAIVDAIGHMHSTQRESHNATIIARAEASAPKKASNRWKINVNTLMHLCEVDAEEKLPDIWQQLANSDKKSDRFVLNAAFKGQAAKDMVEAPLATTRLTTIIVGLNWGSIDTDDLAEGLQPFLTASMEPSTAAKLNTIGLQHDAVLAGAAVSLKDIIDLSNMDKINFPVQFFQAMASLQQYVVALKVLLGENHRLVLVLGHFIMELNRRRNKLEYHCWSDPLFPSSVLRAVQLRMILYFNSAANGVRVPVPDFQSTLCQIETQEWNPPPLPSIYMKEVRDSLIQAGKFSPVGNQGILEFGTDTPGSGAPTATPGTQVNTGKAAKDTPVVNKKAYPEIAALVGNRKTALKIKETISAHTSPKKANGEEFCFSWHGKQQCFPGCGRKKDQADKSALLAYF